MIVNALLLLVAAQPSAQDLARAHAAVAVAVEVAKLRKEAMPDVPIELYPTPYEYVLSLVQHGADLTVYAGCRKYSPSYPGVEVEAIPGYPPGIYRCWLGDNGPVMELKGLTRKGVPYTPRPFVRLSPTTPATVVPNAAGSSARYPAPARLPVRTVIPAPAVSRSGTMRAAGSC